MEIYHLAATKKTPKIILDHNKGYFEFSGIAMPEDTVAFFGPLLKTVSDYFDACDKDITFHFSVYYFNSLSSKMLYELFKLIENKHKSGKTTRIEWIYEEDDESMEEAGKLFLESVEVPSEMILSES